MGKCKQCVFWDKLSNLDSFGYCRFNPPTARLEDEEAVWPICEGEDWCRKFEKDIEF